MDREHANRRLRHRAWRWWKITLSDSMAPLFDLNARLHVILFPFLIYALFMIGGFPAVVGQLVNTTAALWALVFAFPLFVVVGGFAAIPKLLKEESELGQWVGIKFVYHEPLRLLTKIVTADDNGKLLPFKVAGLHKGASAELLLRVEPDYDRRNIRAQFVYSEDMPIFWDSFERHQMLCFLPHDETLFITTHKQAPSNPSTVKVYLVSWGLDFAPDMKSLIKQNIRTG